MQVIIYTLKQTTRGKMATEHGWLASPSPAPCPGARYVPISDYELDFQPGGGGGL